MRKITPFLWFDDKAEEAMNFYCSVFKNSKKGSVTRYGEAGPGPRGSVTSVTFELEGQEFMALNAGPQFSFTPAISFPARSRPRPNGAQPHLEQKWCWITCLLKV